MACVIIVSFSVQFFYLVSSFLVIIVVSSISHGDFFKPNQGLRQVA